MNVRYMLVQPSFRPKPGMQYSVQVFNVIPDKDDDSEMTVWLKLDDPDDAWYEAVADAIRILGKRWNSEFTEAEDAFIEAYADEIAERPEQER